MEKHTWRRAVCTTPLQPSPRWGHAAALVDRELVLFGGYANSQYRNDLWAYDTTSMTWQEVKTTGATPSPRSNCTLHFEPLKRRLILFGGGGPNKLRYCDVSVLDWESKEWKTLAPPQGERAPWERTYHSSELIYPYLVVFGGEGIADLDDLWAFNLETHHWIELPVDKQRARPCARRFHSSVVIGTTLFVIAGCHEKYRCLSDVYSIDLLPFVQDPLSCGLLEWRELRIKGSSFLSRWGHSSSVLGNRIYIFGGRFSSDLQDILVLDPTKQILKPMKVHGELPKPRRRHSGTFVGSSLLIFGGFNGQYFNDLTYINLFQLPQRKQGCLSELCGGQKRLWVNRKLLADFQVSTRDSNIFYGHKGMIIDHFVDGEQFPEFITAIEGKHTLEELLELFQILYSGVGIIPQHFNLDQIDFTLYDTHFDKDAYFRQGLTGQSRQSVSLLSKEKQSQVITLPAPQYCDFLDLRSCFHTDFFIILSEKCSLPANRILLASSSRYFQYLLTQNPQISELRPQISEKQFGDVRVFQVLLNFLETGYLVVPEGLDEECWIRLMQLADYFCLGLRSHCEEELVRLIDSENCEKLLQYGLQERLEDLQAHCLEFIFRRMLERGEVSLKGMEDGALVGSRQKALYEFYRMWEFDLEQLEIKRKQERSIKPHLLSPSQKENIETIFN